MTADPYPRAYGYGPILALAGLAPFQKPESVPVSCVGPERNHCFHVFWQKLLCNRLLNTDARTRSITSVFWLFGHLLDIGSLSDLLSRSDAASRSARKTQSPLRAKATLQCGGCEARVPSGRCSTSEGLHNSLSDHGFVLPVNRISRKSLLGD